MNCIQKQQLVSFPKVRIWKPWFRHFNNHKEFRNEGTVHLFSLMALFSYANFRSNERMISGARYMEAPGQWICKLGSLPRILRVHSKRQVVYYNQLDERWKYSPYGTDTIGGYACGPTAMAIVISSLTSETIDPPHMAQWAYEHGYWCSGNGSYRSLIPGAAQAWSLSVDGCTASEPQRIIDALAEGKLVVALMTKGHFTSSGHFIVLRGCTSDGKILVADPSSYKRSEKSWDMSIILNEASKRAGSGGPFWIIGN